MFGQKEQRMTLLKLKQKCDQMQFLLAFVKEHGYIQFHSINQLFDRSIKFQNIQNKINYTYFKSVFRVAIYLELWGSKKFKYMAVIKIILNKIFLIISNSGRIVISIL